MLKTTYEQNLSKLIYDKNPELGGNMKLRKILNQKENVTKIQIRRKYEIEKNSEPKREYGLINYL